ncbi:hypothetical protein B7Z17_02140, partial [Candidatus Saccharibacteria bacterium 32-49-10]
RLLLLGPAFLADIAYDDQRNVIPREIYLDIDSVLPVNQLSAANYTDEFLQAILENIRTQLIGLHPISGRVKIETRIYQRHTLNPKQW